MEIFDRFSKRDCQYWLKEHYPLTVISDRYDGTYSGGKYTAWPALYFRIPLEVDGSDNDCDDFWSNEADESFIGFGSTVQEAIDDLEKKLKAKIEEG